MTKTDEDVRRKLVNKVWLIVIGLLSVGAIFSAGLIFVKNGKQNK